MTLRLYRWSTDDLRKPAAGGGHRPSVFIWNSAPVCYPTGGAGSRRTGSLTELYKDHNHRGNVCLLFMNKVSLKRNIFYSVHRHADLNKIQIYPIYIVSEISIDFYCNVNSLMTKMKSRKMNNFSQKQKLLRLMSLYSKCNENEWWRWLWQINNVYGFIKDNIVDALFLCSLLKTCSLQWLFD